MKKFHYLLLVPFLLVCSQSRAQSDQHYTMFMYNKLLYNPGYAGSRDLTSVNAVYRRQWAGIPGAPKQANLSVDAPLGTFMRPFRPHAIGFSMGNERMGIENTDNLRAYYAFRMKLKETVLSLGMSGGVTIYSATAANVWVTQAYDPSFSQNIDNVILPNAGAGAYWSGDNFYCGLSVPNLLQNYYDKDLGRRTSKQIRAYYLSGGYAFPLSDDFTIQPQVLARYAMNGSYSLPFNADINLSAIAYNRLMLGFTYRTDRSLEGIVHIQVSKRFNMGYAYEHMMSALNGYSGGTHEIVLGYDIIRSNYKFLSPRFIRKF